VPTVSGATWLQRLPELVGVAANMARERYQGMPDVEDRVSDALLGLAEAAKEYSPYSDAQDGAGYFTQFALDKVATVLRRKAAAAAEESKDYPLSMFLDDEGEMLPVSLVTRDTETFRPSDLGVKYLWNPEDPDDDRVVLDNGAVVTPDQFVQLTLNVEDRYFQADDLFAGLPGSLEWKVDRAIWGVVDALRAGETDVPVPGTKRGIVLPNEEEHYERPRRNQLIERPVDAFSRDTATWSPALIAAFDDAVIAWRKLAALQCSVIRAYRSATTPKWYDDKLETRAGEALYQLRETLYEDADDQYQEESWARSVARNLQERLVGAVRVDSTELLAALNTFFGVDGDGYPEHANTQAITAEFRQRVQNGRRLWPSQKVAITALIDGVSPQQARAMANAARK